MLFNNPLFIQLNNQILPGQVTFPISSCRQCVISGSFPWHFIPLSNIDLFPVPKKSVCKASLAYPNPSCLQMTAPSSRDQPSPQTGPQGPDPTLIFEQ